MKPLKKIITHDLKKVFPAFLVAVLFLVAEHYAGKYDPHTGGQDLAYKNLTQDILVYEGDNITGPLSALDGEVEWQKLSSETLPTIPVQDFIWVNTNVAIENPEQNDVTLFLGGTFSAEIYWNGSFIGRKGTLNEIKETNTAPFLVSFRLDQGLINDGTNSLIMRLKGTGSSFFTSEGVQTFSLDIIQYTWVNTFIHNFMLGAFFLGFLFILTMCSLAYLKESELNKKSGLLVIAVFFLMINFLLIILSSLPANYLDLLIMLMVVTSAGSLGVLLLVLEGEIGKGKSGGRMSVFVFLMLVGLSLFFKKDLTMIFLSVQIIFYLVLLTRMMIWTRRGASADLNCISGLIVFPVLVLYEPYFMASYGIYIFAGVYIMPPAIRKFQSLMKGFLSKNHKKYLDIYSKGQKRLVPVENIQALTAVGHYTEITLKNKEKHIYHHGLTDLLERLPEDFIRIHRSHAVNIKYVDKLLTSSGSKYTMCLKNGNALPVGRKFLKDLKEVLV